MELKLDDVVMCTVKSISGTAVFLEIDDDLSYQVSMVLSEVAAGRIRNLREYVSVGRKVVCKVLQLQGKHVEMSLRRVTGKERDEVLERSSRERTLRNILKTCVPDYEAVLGKIKESYDMYEFVDLVREQPKLLEQFVSKELCVKLLEIMSQKEGRAKEVKREFSLRSSSSQGVLDIIDVLSLPDAEVHYLGSGVFSLTIKGKDFREASVHATNVLTDIAKRAKAKNALFEAKKEK